MKKATLKSLVSYIVENDVSELYEVKDEILAELAKDEAKAQANRDLYAEAHDVVVSALAKVSVPVTIAELYDEVSADLPNGFTKGKFQYAVSRLWTDEIVKTEGKVNAYSLKA